MVGSRAKGAPSADLTVSTVYSAPLASCGSAFHTKRLQYCTGVLPKGVPPSHPGHQGMPPSQIRHELLQSVNASRDPEALMTSARQPTNPPHVLKLPTI